MSRRNDPIIGFNPLLLEDLDYMILKDNKYDHDVVVARSGVYAYHLSKELDLVKNQAIFRVNEDGNQILFTPITNDYGVLAVHAYRDEYDSIEVYAHVYLYHEMKVCAWGRGVFASSRNDIEGMNYVNFMAHNSKTLRDIDVNDNDMQTVNDVLYRLFPSYKFIDLKDTFVSRVYDSYKKRTRLIQFAEANDELQGQILKNLRPNWPLGGLLPKLISFDEIDVYERNLNNASRYVEDKKHWFPERDCWFILDTKKVAEWKVDYYKKRYGPRTNQ